MSGLFVNFFEVKLKNESMDINCLPYNSYASKEAYLRLRNKHPNFSFYRVDDLIYYWKLDDTAEDNLKGKAVQIEANEEPRVFSKIIEMAFVKHFRNKAIYRIYKNNHCHTWEFVSSKDLLNSNIEGLAVNRQVSFNTFFFKPDERILFGFVLSADIKNMFTWDRDDFEEYGIDISGLKGKDNMIFASRQALGRFLTARGITGLYEEKLNQVHSNEEEFKVIKGAFEYFQNHIEEFFLPSNNSIESIAMRYVPFENNKVNFGRINNPRRFYYSGRAHEGDGRLPYNGQVKKYRPYSYEIFHEKTVNIGVLCPREYEGSTESFINKLEQELTSTLHLRPINFIMRYTKDTSFEAYKDQLYDEDLLKSDLVIVVLNEEHKKLPINRSPYFLCKAKCIGNGIPTQDIQIAKIRNMNLFILNCISLNIYAKLGGTAWTIEKKEKRKDELVIGIGSTRDENNKWVLGIAQVFHADGRYIVGNCAPLSTFENYTKNLQSYLYKTLKEILATQIDTSREFRLIFHLFKSASYRYEISAIENLVNQFKDLEFKFALAHLGYGHNFRLFFNDGKGTIQKGLYLNLGSNTALLHSVPESSVPLKIELDKRSTFRDLFYIAEQIFWFSNLSHRSYMPSKKTVTLLYPSLMARLTEKLKEGIEGWDYDRLNMVGDKLWFI